MRRLMARYASAVMVGVGILGSAALVAVGANAVFASSSFAANTTCNSTLTSDVTGSVTVPSGAFCTLDDITVTGSVIVQPGALALVSENGTTIDGYLTSSGAGAIQVTDSTIKASVNVSNTDPSTRQSSRIICTSVAGYVNVSGSNANVFWEIGGSSLCFSGFSNTIGSSLSYNNNAFGGDISNNLIGGSLFCSGNNATPGFLTGANDETSGGNEPAHSLYGQCSTFDPS